VELFLFKNYTAPPTPNALMPQKLQLHRSTGSGVIGRNVEPPAPPPSRTDIAGYDNTPPALVGWGVKTLQTLESHNWGFVINKWTISIYQKSCEYMKSALKVIKLCYKDIDEKKTVSVQYTV